ncbi:MAG: hypothetical protein IJF01_07190 [Tidjanibacter sp.]|nr:hypothetical protein [Tidjanibacter sp.]
MAQSKTKTTKPTAKTTTTSKVVTKPVYKPTAKITGHPKSARTTTASSVPKTQNKNGKSH